MAADQESGENLCKGILDVISRIVEGEYEGRVFLHEGRRDSGDSLLLRLYMINVPLLMVAELSCVGNSRLPTVILEVPGLFLQAAGNNSFKLVEFMRALLLTLTNLRFFSLTAIGKGLPTLLMDTNYLEEVIEGSDYDSESIARLILTMILEVIMWLDQALLKLQADEPLEPLTLESIIERHNIKYNIKEVIHY